MKEMKMMEEDDEKEKRKENKLEEQVNENNVEVKRRIAEKQKKEKLKK
jgi:hypothetical protein